MKFYAIYILSWGNDRRCPRYQPPFKCSDYETPRLFTKLVSAQRSAKYFRDEGAKVEIHELTVSPTLVEDSDGVLNDCGASGGLY